MGIHVWILNRIQSVFAGHCTFGYFPIEGATSLQRIRVWAPPLSQRVYITGEDPNKLFLAKSSELFLPRILDRTFLTGVHMGTEDS